MNGPDREFWQQRFETGSTPWERPGPHPQLIAWLNAGQLTPCRILVPGCGSGWEVALLAGRGFEVTALDYASAAIERCRERLAADGLEARLEQVDVLEYRVSARYDAVYEQTCLCALYPDHWTAYAAQLADWIGPRGRLFAQFMQAIRPGGAAEGLIEGPPYHCDINAMRALFSARDWDWTAPPYPATRHPIAQHELGVILTRR